MTLLDADVIYVMRWFQILGEKRGTTAIFLPCLCLPSKSIVLLYVVFLVVNKQKGLEGRIIPKNGLEIFFL